MKMKEKAKVIAIYRVGSSLGPAKKRASFAAQKTGVARAVNRFGLEVVAEIKLIGMSGPDAGQTVPEIDEASRKLRNREIDGVVVSCLDRLPAPNNAAGVEILDGLFEAKGRIYFEDEALDLGTHDGRIDAMIRMLLICQTR